MKCEKFLEDIVKLISLPEENFERAVNLLENNLYKYDDIRLAILGSFLISKWFGSVENIFIKYLKEKCDIQNYDVQSIIKYLLAFQIYMEDDLNNINKYKKMIEYLEESVNLSTKYVNNYLLLAEYSNKIEKRKLMSFAKNNVKEIWDSKNDIIFENTFNSYINEHVLGVSMSDFRYEELFKTI